MTLSESAEHPQVDSRVHSKKTLTILVIHLSIIGETHEKRTSTFFYICIFNNRINYK